MTGLVFGKSGQVATALSELAPSLVFLAREDVDLSDAHACAAAIFHHRPTCVINAAAYTSVDHAEDDKNLAFAVNGTAPGAMATAAADLDIPFVHISTDYVFNGRGLRPWRPEDPVDPVNTYGASKAAGEEAVQKAGGRYVILRTSWVFSPSGANFVKTMVRLAAHRENLSVVDDQIGGPTSADSIARTCLALSQSLKDDPNARGVFHFAGAPDVSWAGFAREIFSQAGSKVSVQGIPSSDYPTAAKRPANSRMDCSTLFDVFGIERPDWRDDLHKVLLRLKGTNDA